MSNATSFPILENFDPFSEEFLSDPADIIKHA